MPEVIKIEGKHELEGEVTISGAKNATVALIPAAVLANGPVTIVGIPQIADVDSLSEILRILNVDVQEVGKDHLIIDPSNMKNVTLDQDIVTKLRASYYFMGALLGKYGYVRMQMPGGCYLGPRPIDLHIKGFKKLGATVITDGDKFILTAEKLRGANIYLDFASVGATVNLMLAASLAEGQTVIENAAKEPEIINIATLLNNMGASVVGAGTDKIVINGVEKLHGAIVETIPDRIEAGTYIMIGAIAGDNLKINKIIPEHIDTLLSKLRDMGINFELESDSITISKSDSLMPVNIKTVVYPGFPTDLGQPIAVLLTQADGESVFEETIYESRTGHFPELIKMGANIDFTNTVSKITGKTPLKGTDVKATDLRAGAALIIAGLIADGTTKISNIEYILRGYEDIVEKLSDVGADISIIEE